MFDVSVKRVGFQSRADLLFSVMTIVLFSLLLLLVCPVCKGKYTLMAVKNDPLFRGRTDDSGDQVESKVIVYIEIKCILDFGE